MNQNKFLQSYESIKQNFAQNNSKSQNSDNVVSNNNLNFTILQQIRLNNLIDKQTQEIMLGEVIRLAYIETNGQIHIDEQALEVLQLFSSHQIAFVGIYGEREAGKSFFLDNVLNLAGIQGSNFCRRHHENHEKGLFFYSIPFLNTSNDIKTFFVDFVGFEQNSNNFDNKEQKMLLDLTLLLCSSIICFQSHSDKKGEVFKVINKNLLESASRITENNQKTTASKAYWPQNLYCLYRNKSMINVNNDDLQSLFTNFNYTVIHDAFTSQKKQNAIRMSNKNSTNTFKNDGNVYLNGLYLKQASRLIKQILSEIIVKKYFQLTLNGNICCKLLLELIKHFNLNSQNNNKNKNSIIKIDEIYYSLVKQLYELAYEYHTESYDNKLQKFLVDDRAYKLDYLLDAFNNTQAATFKSFRELNINQKLSQDYENKLKQYISKKEEHILQINKKKTKYQLKNEIKNKIIFPKVFQNKQYVLQIFNNIKMIGTNLDHDKSYAFLQPLNGLSEIIAKRQDETFNRKQQEKLSSVKQRISIRKNALNIYATENIKSIAFKNQSQKRLSNLQDLDLSMNDKLKSLKKQIEVEKKMHKKFILNKEAAQQKAQQLLNLMRSLQQKQRDNEKIISDIQKDFEYNPAVQMLNKKLSQVKRSQKTYDLNNLGGSQINSNKKSQIRVIGQGMKTSSYVPSSKFK